MGGDPTIGAERPLGGTLGRLWADRRRRFVALGVVVALVATTGWFLWRDGRAVALPEVAGQATSPAQVGLGFLTAVSQGRSADAAAYLKSDPGATASTSDAVLAVSAQLNPITDIVVLDSEQEGTRGTVTVQYRFGDQQVVDTYNVARSGRYWKLVDVIDVSDPDAPGYVEIEWAEGAVRDQLTINDVALPADEPLLLFPGTYRIGTTNPLLTSDEVLVVPALSTEVGAIVKDSRYGYAYLPSLALTDAGRQQVTQAVQTTIDTCVQAAQLTTSCGLVFPPDRYENHSGSPIESSLRWAVTADSIDIASTRPGMVGGVQTGSTVDDVVYGQWAYWKSNVFGTVAVSGSLSFSTGDTTYYGDSLYYYAVDVSDPDHLVVVLDWPRSRTYPRSGSE